MRRAAGRRQRRVRGGDRRGRDSIRRVRGGRARGGGSVKKAMAVMIMACLASLASAVSLDHTIAPYSMADNLISESAIYKPDIYARYIRDMRFVTCLSCTGTPQSGLDLFIRGSASCITAREDECVNTTHVREYHCNGTRVSELVSQCPGDYACDEGVCALLPDLTITHVEYMPSRLRMMRYASIAVEVENRGFRDSPEANLTLYWMCEPVTKTVPQLDAGNRTVIEFPNALIFKDAGDWNVTAYVDSAFEVAEYREDNNGWVKTVKVELPGRMSTSSGASYLGDEEEMDLSCPETPMMAIGRAKDTLGNYYRDSGSELLRGMKMGPWDATPAMNSIPYADFYFDLDPSIAEATFTDNSSDRDGTITAWYWDFGDGVTYTTQNITYMFPSHGQFMVSLTVTDDSGDNATVTRSILVDPARPNMPRAEFTFGYDRGLNVWHSTAASQGDHDLSEHMWSSGSTPLATGEDYYRQYGSPMTYELTHTVVDMGGRNSSVTRTVQVDSIWLPGQGSTNSCGTTSLAYTLRFLTGDDSYTHQLVDDEIRADDSSESFGAEGGMFSDPVGLVDYTRSQGVNAEIYQNGDFNDIKRFIDDGVPVIVGLTTDGGGNVESSHWVVIVSYCQRENPHIPGVWETVYGIYNPWGYQYELEESRLARYWGEMNLWDSIPMWNRIYLGVSNGPLPPGNLDQIRTELAAAQSLAMMSNGADDFADGEVLEGLTEMVGGTATLVVGFISEFIFGWGGYTDEVPLIGGVFGAVDELIGGVLLGANEFINTLGESLQALAEGWYNPAVLFAELGRMLVATLELLWDCIVAAFEFIVDIFIAIGEFFADLFSAIGEFFCWLFRMDCHPTVCVVENMVSIDACGETNKFLNNLARSSPIGYISAIPAADTTPIYLYLKNDAETGDMDVKVSPDAAADITHTEYVRLKLLGYSYNSCHGDCYDLTGHFIDGNVSWGEGLGYAYYKSPPNSTLLWLFKEGDTEENYVDTEACAGTRTFISPTMDKYTRGKVVGYIRLQPHPDAVPIYRHFNDDSNDFFLSSNRNESERGYVNTGFLGYAYTENLPGTIPLFSYSTRTYEKENITIMCETEERTYDTPIGYIHAEELPCTTPAYKYCKRYVKRL
ncbi:MAG: PKD domain-containing protein [Candidatus Altiarchaeales archaeon]|nr:PKD domain-containing protein [Candidatus Altiarchaeales archaeon]MBD3417275.1 PKD domain-containing protein [Candidatus Altiarchaeales archaeon]